MPTIPNDPTNSTRVAAASTTIEFLLEEPQGEFEARFYEAVLARNLKNVDVLRQLVDVMADRGNYQRALELDRRLVTLRPHDCYARYNLACSLSVLGQVIPALQALDESLQLGYDDFVHMDADADLDAVRQHPGFLRLLERHGFTA
jgi:tetratricopeptide (TPR) repeat protein